MTLAITPIYAGLLGLLFVALSLWVVVRRVRAGAASGDAGDPALSDAIRAHANFAEYVPLGLILMALAEAQGMPAVALHLYGGALLLARTMHAAGMARRPNVPPLRGGGWLLTVVALLAGALGVLGHALL
ncbi:MAG: MAPEG family protein [Rhodosalinus sp.]|uniref:MAPEG family protein n=1 Tax=Rhodosalinus sp. TaxID=2047741 RepID=UPI00397CB9C8